MKGIDNLPGCPHRNHWLTKDMTYELPTYAKLNLIKIFLRQLLFSLYTLVGAIVEEFRNLSGALFVIIAEKDPDFAAVEESVIAAGPTPSSLANESRGKEFPPPDSHRRRLNLSCWSP